MILFKFLISHVTIQNEIHNFFRTNKYGLEWKCKWILPNSSWKFLHFIWIVLTVWFLHTHSKHCQCFQSVLLSLPVGQIAHLPSCLLPPFFTVVENAGCLKRTPLALMALSMSTFPLSALFLIVILPFLLPEKTDTDVFDDSSFLANQHISKPQYKCIYKSNINKAEERFQTPAPCWSRTSAFPHKLVQNIKTHF